MNLDGRKAFWFSVIAGSAFAVTLVAVRKASSRRSGAPHSYHTRVVEDQSRVITWRFDQQFHNLPAGHTLRFEISSPAVVHWTVNQWDSVEDTHTTEIAPAVHVSDLPTDELPPGTRVQFTFYWPGANRWEGEDFELRIVAATREAVQAARVKSD